MQPRVTKTSKSLVIEDWLRGLGRDPIADKQGLGTGTVTNIIREWSAGLEEGVADELREFAVALRKLGLTAPICAVGARVAYMMSKIGLDEDDFYSFMSETYDRCIKLDLQPERLSHDLNLLTDLSESIPWDQIPAHIGKQIARKQQLEEEIQRLESVASEAKTRLDTALEQEAVTMKVLNEYSYFRTEMNKNRILMANLPAVVKTIHGILQLGYDPNTIVSKVSDFEKLQLVEKELKDSVDFLTKRKDKLESDCQFFGSQIDVHSQTLAKYEELEKMGFGLKEQKLLWHKVREIGIANQMSPKEAVQRFLKDVDEEYDAKLGFEAKIQKSKSELQNNALMMQNMDSRMATQIQSNGSVKRFMSSILGTQIEQLTRLSEFSPLTQAAKGEMVAPNELKFSLRKAIETVLGRLDPTDSITKVLETTKLALESDSDILTD
jgi:hypothetical protein